MDKPDRLKIKAPEFPSGLTWYNTRHPISLKELKGKVVLLDFWTFCCINCMHVIPDLSRLEKKYPDELVIIGVHSAKFIAEQKGENIRQAILRYGIRHPVVNDKDLIIWRLYDAHAWPSFALIDPVGNLIGITSGEGIYDSFSTIIGSIIEDYDREEKMNRAPLRFDLEKPEREESPLAFPGKVLAVESANRLFVADTNHNRIIVASLDDLTVQTIVGSGRTGWRDGSLQVAQFNHPQGMAFLGDLLYVADTENHAIRQVDLKNHQVLTLAGNGHQAKRISSGYGLTISLNSPWDLVYHQGILYIAMSGFHQIWQLRLRDGFVEPYAGSSREGLMDGPLKGAVLAQPSGITTDGKKIFVADSESSSIRSVDLPPRDSVKTIVGRDLFIFGDQDGRGESVRLQHPLGVVFDQGHLYIADTYNNKIKLINPTERSAKTILGAGPEGFRDGPGQKALFNEPGGLSIAGGHLYIADTNNQVIRRADLTNYEVETITLTNLEIFQQQGAPSEEEFTGKITRYDLQLIRPGEGGLAIDLIIPEGYQLTPYAPHTISWQMENDRLQFKANYLQFESENLPVVIPFQAFEGKSRMFVDILIYYCSSRTDAYSQCFLAQERLDIPVVISPESESSEIKISYKLADQIFGPKPLTP
ncbi:MAG: thioredoxin-like domain-containing protein [bacterium]